MLISLKSRLKTNSLFFRLLLSFMCIILMFTIFQFTIHNLYIKNIENEVVSANTQSLEFSADKLNQVFAQIENSLVLLYFNQNMSGIKNSSIDSKLPYDTYKSLEAISSFTSNKYASNIFLKDIFIYKDDFDMVLCSSGSYDIDLFFNSIIKEKKYGHAFWSELCNQEFRFKYLPCYKTSDSYYMPIVFKPKNSGSKILVVALVDIDGMVKNIDPTYDSNLYIYNDNSLIFPKTGLGGFSNKFLKSTDKKQRFDNLYIFKSMVGNNEILLLKSTSIAKIHQYINRANMYIILLIILAIIFGIIMSVVFTIGITSPVKQLIEYMRSSGTNSFKRSKIDEMNFIGKSVEVYAGEARHSIRGSNESELKAFFSIAGIEKIYSNVNNIREKLITDKNYRVVCFKINYKKLFIQELGGLSGNAYYLLEYVGFLVETYGNDCLTFQLENNRIITIVSLENMSVDFDQLLDSVVGKMENEKEYIDLTVTVSNTYSKINDIKDALDEVINAYEWRKVSSDFQVIYFNDTDKMSGSFILSKIQELSILNNFITGNFDECRNLVYSTLQENYEMEVRLFHFRLLTIHLVNIFIKGFSNYQTVDTAGLFSINQVYIDINSCFTIDNFKMLIEKLLKEFQIRIGENTKSDNQIIRAVLKYIESHYAEDISLTIVAEKLKLSSSYLSHYFKQETSCNFLDYINQYRINKAKEMLINTDKKIADIATVVGFLNQNSFARTFKKYTGITPKEFRLISNDDNT